MLLYNHHVWPKWSPTRVSGACIRVLNSSNILGDLRNTWANYSGPSTQRGTTLRDLARIIYSKFRRPQPYTLNPKPSQNNPALRPFGSVKSQMCWRSLYHKEDIATKKHESQETNKFSLAEPESANSQHFPTPCKPNSPKIKLKVYDLE